jgi:hypothetical protein
MTTLNDTIAMSLSADQQTKLDEYKARILPLHGAVVSTIVEIGILLSEAKRVLHDDNKLFQRWVQLELRLSTTTAQNYMRVAKRGGDAIELLGERLSLNGVYAYSGTTMTVEQRERVLEAASQMPSETINREFVHAAATVPAHVMESVIDGSIAVRQAAQIAAAMNRNDALGEAVTRWQLSDPALILMLADHTETRTFRDAVEDGQLNFESGQSIPIRLSTPADWQKMLDEAQRRHLRESYQEKFDVLLMTATVTTNEDGEIIIRPHASVGALLGRNVNLRIEVLR